VRHCIVFAAAVQPNENVSFDCPFDFVKENA
jgi:hypothetical protein